MILWMAGAFHSKIEPQTLPERSAYQGPTLTVERVTLPAYEKATGTLEATQAGDISAQIQARIKAIHVKAGDTVKPGDLLVTLDDETIAARTAQARANINALNARLAGAEAHYRRTQYLYAKESATRADLDAARSEYESLKAQKAAARSQLTEASSTQDYGRIRATFPALRIEAYIRESVAVGLQAGQTLEADVEALKLTVPATIEEIVPAANPDARTFLVKMRIENRPGLYPGLFVRLRIPQGEEQVLAIPQSYVHRVGQLDVVWVLHNGQIERRFVRTGRPLPDGRIRIVSGLSGGEQLVPPDKALSAMGRQPD
jgi:multidrug efflux pump subunit AcrA (membrane-fusion protein)